MVIPLSKEHRQHLWCLKGFLLVNSSRINKPFKDYRGKVSVITQVAHEMPEAGVVKVEERNRCSVGKVEKDSDENK